MCCVIVLDVDDVVVATVVFASVVDVVNADCGVTYVADIAVDGGVGMYDVIAVTSAVAVRGIVGVVCVVAVAVIGVAVVAGAAACVILSGCDVILIVTNHESTMVYYSCSYHTHM